MLRKAICLLWLLLLSQIATAQNVVVVVDGDNPVHQQFTASFRRQLANWTVVGLERKSASLELLNGASLVVSLGRLAAWDLSSKVLDVPVINSLIAEADWQRLAAEEGERRRRTALYLNQPPSRLLALVKTAMPGRHQVTVALGPDSKRAEAAIEQGCRQYGLRCDVLLVENEAGIELALRRAAASDQILLVLPDPQVVNTTTARNLILGAYRRGVALVGYSKALVKAGALMAVHSTPEQLGEDASVTAREALEKTPVTVPPSRYPERYSVSVNYQLARALQLDIEPEASLLHAIEKAERNE